MGMTGHIICPHLKGSSAGAFCSFGDRLIGDMEDVTLKLCMGRHYEACSVYKQSLQETISHNSCPGRLAADLGY